MIRGFQPHGVGLADKSWGLAVCSCPGLRFESAWCKQFHGTIEFGRSPWIIRGAFAGNFLQRTCVSPGLVGFRPGYLVPIQKKNDSRIPTLYAHNLSVSSLSWGTCFLGHGYDTSYWEGQDLKFVDQLKHVVIDIINGENELELAKYLVKHAKRMEQMIIYPPLLSHSTDKRVNEFRKITNATVVFRELRRR